MCGIFLEICYDGQSIITSDLLSNLKARGPDFMKICDHDLSIYGLNCKANFISSVLWMQGKELAQQPMEDDFGILTFNGDVFNKESFFKLDHEHSDTSLLMHKLSQTYSQNVSEREYKIIEVLKSIEGPFSLVYFDKVTKKIFFSRDKIGRCSLIFYKGDNNLILSSILGRKFSGCVEVPASSIHVLDLITNDLTLYDWTIDKCICIPLKSWLSNHQHLQSKNDDQFEYTNIESLETSYQDTELIQFIESTSKIHQSKIEIMKSLLANISLNQMVVKTIETLTESIMKRVSTQPYKCHKCVKQGCKCEDHSSVGILFSGGLDCTIIAFLANQFIPKNEAIDLINVAFNVNNTKDFDVPDRITGRKAFEELTELCPSRKWKFLEINVSANELEEAKNYVIADLIYPRQTILDESLGSALWFATKAQYGEFSSDCRVLLVGSGADELFGGYTRHRKAYKRNGWLGLENELRLDWARISRRNLARDNRVICHHGRQPRMPYLDEKFAEFICNLKPWEKCYPSDLLGPGIGDKLLLRLVAFKLGLLSVSVTPKRAIQFGSRIANKKERGSDISARMMLTEPSD